MSGGRPSYAEPATRGGRRPDGPAAAVVLRAREVPEGVRAPRDAVQACAGGNVTAARRWVVDTGASRTICSPSAVVGTVRPSSVLVETANGTVRAVGEAEVKVPCLRDPVTAVVLPGAPCLLSASELVAAGCTLSWSAGRCALSLPCGHELALRVAGGIPVLPERCCPCARPSEEADKPGGAAQAATASTRGARRGKQRRAKPRGRRGGRKRRRAAGAVGAVRGGVADDHRQYGHYPWRSDCTVCADAALRQAPHHRQLPHAGVLAVDITSLGSAGPHVLVGATQQPGWAYAEPLRSRAAEDLRAPLLRMLADARRRGEVATVHSDKEAGVLALEEDLLRVGAKLSYTQGRDPQANGLAEQTVGQLCRMARAALASYDDAVAAALWQSGMVWAAQRLVDPKLPPFGARVIVRHPPAMVLGKLAGRTSEAIYLHGSTSTPGSASVGLLSGSTVECVIDRRTVRASLEHDGRWAFPPVSLVRAGPRGRRAGGHHRGVDDLVLPAVPELDVQEDDVGDWLPEDDVPLGLRRDIQWGPDGGPTQPAKCPRGGAGASADLPIAQPGNREAEVRQDKKRARADGDEDEVEDEGAGPKRMRERSGEGDDLPTDMDWSALTWSPTAAASGLVTRLLEPDDPEAHSDAARAAEVKEMSNMLTKGTFRPGDICDWDKVRTEDPEATIGKGKMILGIKNSELGEGEQVYKGRLVFMGNNIRDVRGGRVLGTTDGLYGQPISLSTARLVLAAATLRGWEVEVGDVKGAYLTADLGGPPVYLRLSARLWEAAGVQQAALSGVRDPCLRVRKAMYGLPRAGFDWFAHCDALLVAQGWERHAGVDSVYRKTDAMLALYVDDIVLAGTPHGRRREWAALRLAVRLRGDPEPLARFLGVGYAVVATGKHTRTVRARQEGYIGSILDRYDAAAPFKATPKPTPCARRADVNCQRGEREGDCRSYVGALMCVVRASRPDAAHAVNRLARNVHEWARTDDADLAHVMGYLRATQAHELEMVFDVRDRKGNLWLELYVDADHAGEDDRRSTGGWVLMLRGQHGTSAAIDWASRKQAAVARSSGEAETKALHDAVRSMVREEEDENKEASGRAVGVNRALCSGGIPAMDFLEKALGRTVPLKVFVDATVCKAAAEKGTSRQMKYLSKTQCVDLFWLRDTVHNAPLELVKVESDDNVADILTKPLPGQRTAMLRGLMGVCPPHNRASCRESV